MIYGNNWGGWPNYMFGGFGSGIWTWMGTLLVPFVIWGLFWKGWALWRAAKNGSKAWFIVLLVVNTLGILEILYIFVFGKKASSKK